MVYHFSVIASREELTRAEVEAWHRTHYRLDWLLYRTIGYALLSSTLAIYVYWAEAGANQTLQTALALSVTWVVLLAFGMLWYDFHTRVSYETWPEVRRRLTRHIAVSCLSFVGAFVIANAIHGVSVLIDKANQPAPNMFAESVKDPTIPDRPVRWRKGGAKDPATKAAGVVSPGLEKPTTPANKTGKSTTTTTKSAPSAKVVDPKAKPASGTVAAKKTAPPKTAVTTKKPTVKSSSTKKRSRRRSRRRN